MLLAIRVPATNQRGPLYAEQALAAIRTKDFTTSWTDFTWAWERVKVPAGTPSWQQMVKEAKDMPTPAAGRTNWESSLRKSVGVRSSVVSTTVFPSDGCAR